MHMALAEADGNENINEFGYFTKERAKNVITERNAKWFLVSIRICCRFFVKHARSIAYI